MRVGVLASGAGTNLQALIDRVHGRGTAELVAIASDRADAYALERGRAAGIPARVFPEADFGDRDQRDLVMRTWLEGCGVELVVLAGYMRLLSPGFLAGFPQRVINVHPSLLPAFPGVRAIEQAVEYGVKVFGVTVHFVDEGIDTGAIIAQRAIELPDVADPTAVHEALRPLEHELLSSVVLACARGAVTRTEPGGRRVRAVL
jgi:phosphoribosylglycinamide formyltransferase-1